MQLVFYNDCSSVTGDVDNMFKDFIPLQLGCLRQYTTLIPGTADTSKILKNEFGNYTVLFSFSMYFIIEYAVKSSHVNECYVFF